MAFKRKRVYAPKRSVRRKTGRSGGKFKKGGSRKVASYSTRSSGVNGLQYRGRRISKRKYTSALFRSTQFASHYRSVSCTSNPLTTPASVSTVGINRLNAIDSLFWTAAGGAQQLDPGTAVPTFRDNIVIRGGRIWIDFCNNDADAALTPSVIEVTCMLIKTTFDPDFTVIPAGPVPRGWDVSMVPDFTYRVGKVVMYKKFLLKPFETMSLEYRIPCRKIDQGIFSTSGGNAWQWFTTIGNTTDGVATLLQETRGHSLSFVGDAVS